MSTTRIRKLLDDFIDDRPDCLDEWLFYVRELEGYLEAALTVIEAAKLVMPNLPKGLNLSHDALREALHGFEELP